MAQFLKAALFSAIVLLCIVFSVYCVTEKPSEQATSKIKTLISKIKTLKRPSEFTRENRVNYIFQCMLLRRLREELALHYLPTIRRYTDIEQINFDDFFRGCHYLDEHVLKSK